ncbi:MAG: hypothetical protein E5W04_02225 [Mesorhizobium sp.]|nr:MAG: hypothetical protein E5W04_02225 [Mesorhizobium sp.]
MDLAIAGSIGVPVDEVASRADLTHDDRARQVLAISGIKLRRLRLLFRLRKLANEVLSGEAKAEARKAGKNGRAAEPGRNATQPDRPKDGRENRD